MGLAHEKKSYLQEKANLFEIGSNDIFRLVLHYPLLDRQYNNGLRYRPPPLFYTIDAMFAST